MSLLALLRLYVLFVTPFWGMDVIYILSYSLHHNLQIQFPRPSPVPIRLLEKNERSLLYSLSLLSITSLKPSPNHSHVDTDIDDVMGEGEEGKKIGCLVYLVVGGL